MKYPNTASTKHLIDQTWDVQTPIHLILDTQIHNKLDTQSWHNTVLMSYPKHHNKWDTRHWNVHAYILWSYVIDLCFLLLEIRVHHEWHINKP